MARSPASRPLLPAIAVAAIVGAGIVVWQTQPDRSRTTPDVTPPTAPATGPSVSGTGVIEPAGEPIAIAAEVAGVVDRVFVEPGARVAAGAALFSVDSRAARAAVVSAEARLARLREEAAAARVTRAVADRQLALYGAAGDPRAVSRQEVIARQGIAEDAAAAVSVAEAAVREAAAQLAAARVDLERHTVRAPRAATVLRVRTRTGEYAPAGPAAEALMTLGVTDPLHVRLDIDETEIARVAVGAAATISPRGDAARRVSARFVRAEPLVVPKRSLTNSASERVDVRVLQLVYALPADAKGWYVGQQVDGFLPARGGR